MPPNPTRRPDHRRGQARRLVVFAWLAVIVASVTLAAPTAASAHGATGPRAALCVPSETTGCIAGTLRSEKEVLDGVDVVVTSPSGEDTTITTDERGKWSLEITETGTYEITLDEDTLPEGVVTQGTATVNGELGKIRPGLIEIRTVDYDASQSRFDLFLQQAASGLRLGLLLALAAVGLSLIYGTTGLSSFSHAEQVTLGGILAFMLVNWVGMPFLLAAVLTVALCAATGFLQDVVIWKPLRRRGLGLVQMMIVTIGLSLAMQYAFQVFIGARNVRVLTASPGTVSFGPVSLTYQSFWAMGVSVVVLVAVGWVLLRTRLGRATRAVSDNPSLAAASGIDVDRVVRLVWIASTGLAGLSGIMLALVLNGVKWDSGMQILLLLFAAVTLGGLGTAFGALVGSLVVGMVVELAPVLAVPGDLKYAAALLILILLLMVRPQGLLGRAERVG